MSAATSPTSAAEALDRIAMIVVRALARPAQESTVRRQAATPEKAA